MRTTSRSDLAVRLRLAITRTSRRLRQEAGGALGPAQTSALAVIDAHGPLTPSELANREGIQRPTVTRLLGRLEAAGLVERTADPGDGRSSLITASAAGRELLRELRLRKDVYLARRLAGLDLEERATLARAAAILERLLEEDRA
ncbi:MAG: MarR family transcriptional regulator [Actinomycetota bacterium]|nr:MarR family transcriptional regulator [Actinomycetota bacterium]